MPVRARRGALDNSLRRRPTHELDRHTHLKEAVDRARAEYLRPSVEDETKPILPLALDMKESEWELVWKTVRALRREHQRVFIRF